MLNRESPYCGPSEELLSQALSVLKVQPDGLKCLEGENTMSSHLDVMKVELSVEDIALLHATLDGVRSNRYTIPAPHRQTLQLTLDGCVFLCDKDDFFVSFTSFLHFLPPELQLYPSITETNRH